MHHVMPSLQRSLNRLISMGWMDGWMDGLWMGESINNGHDRTTHEK